RVLRPEYAAGWRPSALPMALQTDSLQSQGLQFADGELHVRLAEAADEGGDGGGSGVPADSDEEHQSFRTDDDHLVAERRCRKYCEADGRHHRVKKEGGSRAAFALCLGYRGFSDTLWGDCARKEVDGVALPAESEMVVADSDERRQETI